MTGNSKRYQSPTRLGVSARWLGVAVTLLMLFTALPAQVQPAAAADDGTYTISVQKYNCPAGFDAYTLTGQQTFDNCTDPATGINFSVTTDDGSFQSDTRATGSDGNSQATWTGVPLNTTFTLQESIPDGYGLPMIYCLAYTSAWDANQGYTTPDFSFGQGNVSAHIDDSYSQYPNLDCYWFNVPSDSGGGYGTDNSGDSTPTGSGSITINKWTCWLDYNDSSAPGYDYLTNQCTKGYPNAKLQVQYGSNDWNDVQLDQQGTGSYDQYGGGQFALRELPSWPHPPSYVVYCSTTDDQGNQSDYDNSYQQGGQVGGNLSAGWSITCDWFNVFYPSLQITKYACDNTKDYTQSDVDELLQHCQPQKNVDFDIQHGSDPSSTETTNDSGQISDYFTIDQDNEQVGIAEHVPDGYTTVRVFCSTAERGSVPDPMAGGADQ